MRVFIILAALFAASMAQLPLFEPPKTHSEIMHIIEQHYLNSVGSDHLSLLGKRSEADKRNIFDGIKKALSSVGNFFKNHEGDLLKAAESLLPSIPVLLGKKSVQDPLPKFITDLMAILEKEKEVLKKFGESADESFPEFVDKVNYLDRFTHTTNPNGLVRRGFFDNILSGLKTSAEYVASHIGQIATTAVTTLLPTAVSLLGKRSGITDIPAQFGEFVKHGVMQLFEKIEAAYKGAMQLSNHLLINLKEGIKSMIDGGDIKTVAQKVIADLTADVHAMFSKNLFVIDLEKMVENLVPEAAKMLTHINKRFLLDDLVNGVKDSIGDVVGMLTNGFGGLKQFFSGIVQTANNALAPSLTNVKALATTFLSHATQVTANIAAEALKFFKPFASALGPLWNQINGLVTPLLQASQ
ncbi:uncharacterized protein LOC126816026 [Patella vulgata]|uniref:uncharacterized protein LOC126816026 n=1 Tax=Patella vulgata TaxID=6465 RepID=UPI0024A82E5E|nr:uncharacterized protein LOC126816026 [Patella vulgata]